LAQGEDFSAPMARLSAVIKHKVATGKCFSVQKGELALLAAEWQSQLIWEGIAVLATRSGRRFYSASWNWQYAGDVESFVP
jgi:hypothetical protein